MDNNTEKHFETLAIRTQTERTQHREHAVPIFATSSFMFESAEQAQDVFAGNEAGNIYSRYSNPSNDEFLEKLCLLEGTEDGVTTSSGMAAMFISIASFLKSGDHIVASRSLFGSTHQIITELLPRWGITYTYVDIHDLEGFEKAIVPETKMIFTESPSNPSIDLLDIRHLADVADRHGIILNVDNCFATPYLQNPAKLGAHIVTHSATKFMDGQGRVLGGAVLGRTDLIEKVRFMARHTGPALSPFHGWVLSKSLETLPVRMERHCSNALALAEWLETQDAVNFVKYPFLKSHPQYELAIKQMKLGGGVLSFEIKGGIQAAQHLINSLKMISITSNLGDTRTIVTHPATTTHSKLSDEERESVGITPGLIRISCGLEHIDDIKADLARGFKN